jgi:MFS transporter, DHA1 family, multidrug resistance protein
VPIIGTAFYVWGNSTIIISIIPYLFDAYPPAGTLSALTAAASGRILFAGMLPLVILQDLMGTTPKWAFSIFGFISIVMWPIPFLLFRFEPTWWSKSKYSRVPMVDGMQPMGPSGYRKMSSDGDGTAYDPNPGA